MNAQIVGPSPTSSSTLSQVVKAPVFQTGEQRSDPARVYRTGKRTEVRKLTHASTKRTFVNTSPFCTVGQAATALPPQGRNREFESRTVYRGFILRTDESLCLRRGPNDKGASALKALVVEQPPCKRKVVSSNLTVGSGDRCIRSDLAFRPTGIRVRSPTTYAG